MLIMTAKFLTNLLMQGFAQVYGVSEVKLYISSGQNGRFGENNLFPGVWLLGINLEASRVGTVGQKEALGGEKF